MRESFGGAFMIKLVLVFIVVYISFMAVSVNYAKTFRVKNNIINILEQNQYNSTQSAETSAIQLQIGDYIKSVPYTVDQDGNKRTKLKEECTNKNGGQYMYGVCIEPKSGDSNKGYYKVTVYIDIDFSFFDIYMTIPVSGETKTIYYK